MKLFFEKKVNKWLIGAILGSAVLGFGGFSMSPKGKGLREKFMKKFKGLYNFLGNGVKEMYSFFKKNK